MENLINFIQRFLKRSEKSKQMTFFLAAGLICLLIFPGLSAAELAPVWVSTYKGTPDKDDYAADVAIDADYNIYAIGRSKGIWPGEEQYSDYDAVIVKFDSDRNLLWSFRYDPIDIGNEKGVLIEIAQTGEIYGVVTYAYSSGYDMILIRIGPTGDVLWTRKVVGMQPYKMAVTSDGNVAVFGVENNMQVKSWLTVSFDADGNQLFTTRDSNTGNNSYPVKIVADELGNFIVAGNTYYTANIDYQVIKYSPTGAVMWTYNYVSGEIASNMVDNLLIDKEQNVLVVSRDYSPSTGTTTPRLRKLDPSGNLLWTQSLDEPGSGYWQGDYLKGAVVDSANNIYIAGGYFDLKGERHLGVKSFSEDGVNINSGYFSELFLVTDMVIDKYGTISIINPFEYTHAPLVTDWGLIQIQADLTTYSFSTLLGDFTPSVAQGPSSLALTQNGDIIVSGSLFDGSTYDFAVARFSSVTSCCEGNKGDVNGDGTEANMLDLTYLVDFVFRGGLPTFCPDAGDVNGDNAITNIIDLTFMVDYIFRGGVAPGACSGI